jgi:hypothetical protein
MAGKTVTLAGRMERWCCFVGLGFEGLVQLVEHLPVEAAENQARVIVSTSGIHCKTGQGQASGLFIFLHPTYGVTDVVHLGLSDEVGSARIESR